MKPVREWLARHPLAVCLPLQALLLFWRLDLLSPWFDEADTLLFTRGPIGPAIAIPASGLHPPLYFALLWCWMRLPLGLSWTMQARTLSVLFTLAAGWAFDRWWARRLERTARWMALALWSLSPFLLLYGRMSRSYSLQLLLGVVGAALILRFAENRTRFHFAALAGLLIVAVYTHYVPGVALLAAAAVALLRVRRWRDAAALNVVVLVALAPWMAWLIPQLQTWGSHRVEYALTGGSVTEIALKLAYWAMSFTLGEALADPVLLAGAVIVVAALAMVCAGLRRNAELAWVAIPASVVGFLGVTRWVAYPFVPARMIFVFPLFLVLLVAGARRWAAAAMLAASLAGIWCYFHLEGFRNKEYPMPMTEIAARIRAGGAQTVLVDSTNSDAIGLQYALGGDRSLETEDPKAAAMVKRWLDDPAVRTIWFLRSTHDVSRQGLDARFDEMLRGRMRATAFGFEPFSPLELSAMRALGMRDPPAYFQELIEYRR